MLLSTQLTEVRGFSDFFSEFFQACPLARCCFLPCAVCWAACLGSQNAAARWLGGLSTASGQPCLLGPEH